MRQKIEDLVLLRSVYDRCLSRGNEPTPIYLSSMERGAILRALERLRDDTQGRSQ